MGLNAIFICSSVSALLIFGLIFVIIRNSNRRNAELDAAHNAYEQALNALKRDPVNPDRKQKALELGRAFAYLVRENKGRTTFDEMMLSNDISAATAGAGTLSLAATTAAILGPSPTAAKADVAVRLAQLDTLKAQGIITDAEHQAQRAKILADL